MGVQQWLKRFAGSPLRQFFDRRFAAVDARVQMAAADARDEVAAAQESVLKEIDLRLERMAYDVAAVSRAHLESMSYVAAEIERLQAALSADLHDLAGRVARAAGPQLADAYVVRALSNLPPGTRILAIGHRLDLAPIYLAQLGHAVTVVASEPYALGHENLEITIGDPADLSLHTTAYGAVVLAPPPAVVPHPAAVAPLIEPGGRVVAVIAADHRASTELGELEVVDETGDAHALMFLTTRQPGP